MPHNDDGPLAGGTANRGRVIRVGDTVHRPVGPHTPAVHALLRHLAARGFDAVPRVVGMSERAEVLGYLDGAAATEPIPAWALTDSALRSVGALLRDYHAACAGFDVTGWHWQRPLPRPWQGSIVTHNDLNPANVIFRDGRGGGVDRLRSGRAGHGRVRPGRDGLLLGAAAGR